MGKRLRALATLAIFLIASLSSWANPSSGFNAIVAVGDLAFGAGGVNARYLVLENWSATDDYQINSMIKRNDKVWVALTDPAVGDEPGTAAAWVDLAAPEGVPGHAIPNVGRLPTVTNDSPELVFLTHDYFEGGQRTDATLTIGFSANGLAGFSDNLYIQPLFGSITEGSPMNALFGSGQAGDYSIQSLVSFNEGWVDELDSIYINSTEYPLNPKFLSNGAFERRIQANPTGLSAATLRINFKRTDGTFYWTDGSGTEHKAGLYAKVGNPLTYHDIQPIEESHRDGEGSAACGDSDPPSDAAQVCIDDDGRAYFSTDRVVLVEDPAEIEETEILMTKYHNPGASLIELQDRTINGEFAWSENLGDFAQIINRQVDAAAWEEVWQYISNIDEVTGSVLWVEVTDGGDGYSTTENPSVTIADPVSGTTATASLRMERRATDSIVAAVRVNNGGSGYVGVPAVTISAPGSGTGSAATAVAYLDEADTPDEIAQHEALRDDATFLGEFSTTALAAEDRDGYTDDTERYFYVVHGDNNIYEITSFTEAVETESAEHDWRGPVITSDDVFDIVTANPDDDITGHLDSIRVGDTVYNSIVRPDPITGDLRDPIAADWDAVGGYSLSIAWDGAEWLQVERYLEGGHSADAVFVEEPVLTTFDGGRYRWRGESTDASPNINQINGDFYFWSTGLTLREWVASSNRWVSRSRVSALARGINYIGYALDQDGALGVSEDNQRVIYHREPERARGTVRVSGTEGAMIPLGTLIEDPNSVQFYIIETGVIPAAGHVDVRARARTGGSNGNVADDTVFTLTEAITGVSTIQAEGAFTRGDDVSGGRQLFRATNVMVATADEFRYRWVPVDPDSEAVGTFVGPDPISGMLRDAVAADFNALSGQSNTLAFDGVDTLRAARRRTSASTASCTWETVPDQTQINTNHRWRGTHYQDYLVDDEADGDVYFNRHDGFRVRAHGTWGPAAVSDIFTGVVYLGAFNSQDEGCSHATANSQWALNVVTSAPIMQRLTAFTAGQPNHYDYYWTPVNPPITLPPVPFPAEQDQILRWSLPDSRYVATQLVTGDSIDGIGTAGDPLVVDTHDVIETLTEHIRYYHSGSQGATNRGSTVCEVYQTGPFQYGVTHIRVGIDAPAAGAHYRGRLYTLRDDNVIREKLGDTPERGFSTGGESHYLYFDSHGVNVPDNTRAAVCVSRTRVNRDTETRLYFGDEDDDSPSRSYPDAHEDWRRLGWVQYYDVDPSAGTDDDHGDTDGNATIHGNIEIFYRRTVNYGSLLGADHVDLDHLADDVIARMLPASPGNNQIAQYNTGNSQWEAVDPPSGGTADGVANSVDLSLATNDLTITVGRSVGADLTDTVALPAPTTDTTLTEEEVEDFVGGMVTGNTETGITIAYQDSDGTLDFVVTTPVTWVDSASSITYRSNDADINTSRFTGSTAVTADLNTAGTADASIGDLFLFQWRAEQTGIPDSREIGIRVNGSDGLPIRVVDPNTTSLTTLEVGMLTRYSLFFVLRVDGAFLQLGGNDLSKLAGIAAGAEVNVQSDWNQTTTTADDFIQNKPTIPAAPATWALASGATGTAPVARLGTGTPDATTFLRGDGAWSSSTAVSANPGEDDSDPELTGIRFGATDYDVLDTTELQAEFNRRVNFGSGIADGSWALDTGEGNGDSRGMTWTGTEVLVVDRDTTVYRYTSDGMYLGDWALTNTDGDNDDPHGITWTGSEVLVVDASDGEVYRYNASGAYQGKWSLHSGNTFATGITWNGSQVVVLDGPGVGTQDAIYRYQADGTYVSMANINIMNDRDNPSGITWTGAEYLIANGGDDDVYRYAEDASLLGSWPIASSIDPTGIAWLGSLALVSTSSNDLVYRFGFLVQAEPQIATQTARPTEAYAVFPELSPGTDAYFAGEPTDVYVNGISLGDFTLAGTAYSTFTVLSAGDYVAEIDIPFNANTSNDADYGFTLRRNASCPTTAAEAGQSAIAARTFTKSGRWFGAADTNDCFWLTAPNDGAETWPAGTVFSLEKVPA